MGHFGGFVNFLCLLRHRNMFESYLFGAIVFDFELCEFSRQTSMIQAYFYDVKDKEINKTTKMTHNYSNHSPPKKAPKPFIIQNSMVNGDVTLRVIY